MNFNIKKTLVAVPALLITAVSYAQAAPATVDYSGLTGSVDFSTLQTALLAVAGLVVGFILVKNGIKVVKSFISSNAK